MKENQKKLIKLLAFIQLNGPISSKEIHESFSSEYSYATLKRSLAKLVSENSLQVIGNGRGTKYKVSPIYSFIQPINIEEYYIKEIDERSIKQSFNFEIFDGTLNQFSLFTNEEENKLTLLQEKFQDNISKLSKSEYNKEFERLAIDLSWKSSQIEGNTYSLLETERLLKDKETASGKTKEEAVMLLNHKDALDFILEHPDFLSDLTVNKIEAIHSILIKELPIERNLRKRRVGISGTNYRPLDNEFQLVEALEKMCLLINNKTIVFEKALLALVFISYIQPFNDGNKRTARIVSNAILMDQKHCPLSFRTVDSVEYKKAMLVFYEQNNISCMKEIFMQQFEFAVNMYF